MTGAERVIRPFGESALLVEVPSLDHVLDLHAALARDRPDGVIDLVPAARTILVHVDPAVISLARARAWIEAARADPSGSAPAPRTREIPIAYDGPDLDELAAALHITRDELIARHRESVWRVAFTGFAPGFGYLVSDDWPYDIPRRSAPRTRVPAGSVGLAGRFSGAYPRSSPGGWQLIGRTDTPLFAPRSPEPVSLRAGDRVRFIPADVGDPPVTPPPEPPRTPSVEVLSTGVSATIQDGGRPGLLADGVSVSGAFDLAAARLANRLVGNPEGAAVIELVLGGFRAVARRNLWVVLAGSSATLRIDGRLTDAHVAAPWHAGEVLEVGPLPTGLRTYLATSGGLLAEPFAGSLSTDTLAGLGPPPLRPGDGLVVGESSGAPPLLDIRPWGEPGHEVEVDVHPGPRSDRLTAEGRRALLDTVWVVSAASDRIGVRLEGGSVALSGSEELPSEGMLPGAIQIPPGGGPIAFGPDAPATGGYPVVAVVSRPGLAALAAARPGDRVRLRGVGGLS